MAALTPETVVRLSAFHRLQWEQVQEAYVLLYPEGMVTLNGSAGDILSRCDGARNLGEIIGELQRLYSEPDGMSQLTADVLEFVEVACNEGWLRTV